MLLRRQVSEERDEHIDMTPMVDVVFQLMTFMLFSVQMSGGEKINVPPARHGIGVEESEAIFLSMEKPDKPGAPPRLRTGKDGTGPVTDLEGARKYVEQLNKTEGKRKVVLQADGDVPHGEFVKAAAAITQVEGVTLHIGVQEKK
ncbi:MAG TPA: biopolymer transporter ExbD [Isosphaeraceae bacterium]|jgi:biopolymer transport protein ExbD|nr:biopolymer transporter ExbD [Isosphaeraceae bacterium]